MTFDQLREKAENATPGPWVKGGQSVWSSDTHAHIAKIALSRDAEFVAAFPPEVALAFVEYVQAQKAFDALSDDPDDDAYDCGALAAAAKRCIAADTHLFSLLEEKPPKAV